MEGLGWSRGDERGQSGVVGEDLRVKLQVQNRGVEGREVGKVELEKVGMVRGGRGGRGGDGGGEKRGDGEGGGGSFSRQFLYSSPNFTL